MSNHRMWNVFCVFVAVLGCLMAGCSSASAVELTKDGEPVAVIVHNGHNEVAPEIPKKPLGVGKGVIDSPATELQEYLEKMSGAKLPMVASAEEAGERPAVVLRVVEHVPGASDELTGKQAYRITTENDRIYLTAANQLGLHNAVYGFLEDHLDCHFYASNVSRHAHGVSRYAGPGYEVVPQKKTLRVGQIDDLQEPALPNRGLIFKMGQYPWILKNRGISGTGGRTSGALASGHTMYHWIPPKDKKRGKRVIAEGLFDEHPEFFPMTKEGKREPDMWNMGICGTAEELSKYLAGRILDEMGDQSAETSRLFKIGQGDGFAGCYCEDCRDLVHEKESEAAPLIHMFNETLDIVNEKYPNVRIITFCYFNTLEAPENMSVHDNLWINVVSSARSKNAAGDQMGPIQDNPANDDYARAFREWPRIAPNRVTVWHWDTYRAEWPSMFYVGENVRYMVENGVYGINPQTCGGPWDNMLNWLYMKMTWNPDQDADALIMQYLEDVYSEAAAPYMWDYLKTGQKAYEAALHVPSAVRWSGWTRITMDKLFPESVRAKMVPLMDKALAAARKHGTEEQLDNLLKARTETIDKVVMEAAGRIGQWDFVSYQGDRWYVAGGNPHVPDIIQRNKAARGNIRSISRYARSKGGPVVPVADGSLEATVCPDLAGQIVSAVDEKSGKELLDARSAQAGYQDVFGKIHTQLWLPVSPDADRADLDRSGDEWVKLWSDYKTPRGSTLITETVLSGKEFSSDDYLHRTVEVTDEGLRIARTYTGASDKPGQFTTRWRLAMPEPNRSRLGIRGGGIKELMDLRYAEPGGIRTVKAGERPPGYEGLDAMDEKWDAVKAVSDAQVVEFEVKNDQGDLQIQLDRGDGVAAVVTTPVSGWSAVKVKPVVGKEYVELTLVGQRLKADGKRVADHELPLQTLQAKPMDPVEAVADEEPVEPQIKVTGDNTAINEVDGAELVWVPAGKFVRGSQTELAGADEGPQKEIHLDGYWVYKYPVTVGQYKAYCEDTGTEFKPPWPQGKKAAPEGDPDKYAVIANWFEARRYAEWAGGSIPTEAQWEKAARGTDGRAYPWGNEWDPAKCVSMENTLYEFNEGFRPVGSHPEGASPYGAMDMAGNVWEWTADWYKYEYYADCPTDNPTGPEVGANKVVRGGCSLYDWRFNRTSARFVQPPQVDNWTAVGFRLVINADKEGKVR